MCFDVFDNFIAFDAFDELDVFDDCVRAFACVLMCLTAVSDDCV